MKNILRSVSFSVLAFAAVGCSRKSSDDGYRVVAKSGVYSGMEIMNEINFYKGRIQQAKNPSAMDLAYLADAYTRQGKITLNIQDYDNAEVLARESLKVMNVFNPTAHVVLAKAAENRHEFTEAIAQANLALKDKPGNPAALAILVSSNLARGSLIEAATSADVLALMAPNPQSFALSALVQAAQGRDEEAEFNFKRAMLVGDMSESQGFAWICDVYARFLMKHGELTRAQALLERSNRIFPQNAFSQSLNGDLAMIRGDYKLASKKYMQAFEYSRLARYLYWFGKAQAAQGKGSSAKEAYAQAEDILRKDLAKPRSMGHRLDLARVLMEKSDPASLRETAELAIAETQNRPTTETYLVCAQAMVHLKKFPAATNMALSAIRLGVHDADATFEMSALAAAMGQSELARFYLKRTLAIQPFYKAASDAVWSLAKAKDPEMLSKDFGMRALAR